MLASRGTPLLSPAHRRRHGGRRLSRHERGSLSSRRGHVLAHRYVATMRFSRYSGAWPRHHAADQISGLLLAAGHGFVIMENLPFHCDRQAVPDLVVLPRSRKQKPREKWNATHRCVILKICA